MHFLFASFMDGWGQFAFIPLFICPHIESKINKCFWPNLNALMTVNSYKCFTFVTKIQHRFPLRKNSNLTTINLVPKSGINKTIQITWYFSNKFIKEIRKINSHLCHLHLLCISIMKHHLLLSKPESASICHIS